MTDQPTKRSNAAYWLMMATLGLGFFALVTFLGIAAGEFGWMF